MRSALSLLLVVAAAHAPGFAQAPAAWSHEAIYTHAWPEPSPAQLPGSLIQPRSAALVRFDAAARVDAVVLRAVEVAGEDVARTLFVMRDVARAHACVPLGDAIDFTVVPCGPGQHGVLALLADGSLRLHRWPTGQASPSSSTVGAWPGYRRIQAVRNGAVTEIVGFDFVGMRIRRAPWTGAQLGAATNVTTPASIGFVDAMDWDNDGVSELLLGSTSTTFVSSWTSALLASLPVGGLPLGGLPIGGMPSGVATLRCVSHAPGGDHLVSALWDGANTLLTWANAATSGTMLLGPFAPGSLVAFDRDGDGDDDLVVADANSGVLRLLVREQHGYRLEAVDLTIPPESPTVGIVGLAAGDLDGDGDGDVLAWQRGSMRTHTLLDAGMQAQRPIGAHGDVFGAVAVGSALRIGVDVQLPTDYAFLHPVGTAFHLQVDGWLVDPATGFVRPQRALSTTFPIVSMLCEVAGDIVFAPLNGAEGAFQLQLQVALVATTPGGAVRPLPSLMLHLTNDALVEENLRAMVASERVGGAKGKGDGGGDGNIAGTKTGKHQISEPPE